jgi:hypothetical protein
LYTDGLATNPALGCPDIVGAAQRHVQTRLRFAALAGVIAVAGLADECEGP